MIAFANPARKPSAVSEDRHACHLGAAVLPGLTRNVCRDSTPRRTVVVVTDPTRAMPMARTSAEG